MTRGRILLVEDDAAIALVISETLRGAGLDVTTATGIGARDRHLADHAVDLLITDVMLPDGDGLASLAACRTVMGDVPVIVLSAQNTLDTAIRAANEHAYEYLPKPFDIDQLTAAVTAALRTMPAAEPLPREETINDFPIVGRSPAMQDVYRTIARVASNDLSVLVLGESGTGKELVARAIHMSGRRRDQPFVALNMAAIPRELIEAELFGHEKGAFTGAHARSPGRFEQAQGGTLFLDEIGDMPIEAQTRLLRVLQTGDYTPVGGSRLLRADVRIVAATNQDLTALVADGRFREDLFYRLNVIPVQLPPLRDRRSDIARLVRHFLDQAAADGLGAKAIAGDALAAMEEHGWPGNVRELGNMVQRLVVLSRDAVIGRDDVMALLNQRGSVQGGQGAASRRHDLVEAVIGWARSRQVDPALDGRLYDALLDEVEPALLSVVLEATGGNQLRAADRLGINRNTLRKKLQQERGGDSRQI